MVKKGEGVKRRFDIAPKGTYIESVKISKDKKAIIVRVKPSKAKK